MGTDDPGIPPDGEGPQRRVWVDSVYMEEHEVTNQQFQHFVNQSGYVTEVRIAHITHLHIMNKVLRRAY